MRMRIQFIGLMVLTSVLASAQTVTPAENEALEAKKECNIRLYNYYTNLAELQILDSTYQKALNYYDSAFYYGKSTFYRDRYNYLVCNALVGKYEKCRSEIIYLLEKGMNRNVLLNNPAFSSFLLSDFGEDIPKLNVRLTYDTSLRSKYDSLVIADQSFRKLKPHHYREYYSDTIDKIDSSNVEFMKELIRDYGWPTIDNIGIPERNYFQYQLIIMHQGGDSDYQYYNFAEDILCAYENCLIEPDRAKFLISWSNNTYSPPACLFTAVYDSLDLFTKDSLFSFCYKTGFLNLNSDEISKIEKERKFYALESISDLKRKLLYGLKDKRFILEYLGGMDIVAFGNFKDYKHCCNNIVPIE